MTVTGTDMGTGAPVSTVVSVPFTVEVAQPPAPPTQPPFSGCTQTPTQACAFERFEIIVVANEGSGPQERPVERHFPDGARINVFDVPLQVQIQNGCNVNDHFWVFADSATDVEVNLTVTDTASGQTRTYTNPLGSPFQPIQDTSAFATCP